MLAGGLMAAAPPAAAQDTLLPEQSAAKAKGLIQQAIQALGGQAYLGVRDTTCSGRFAQFGHSGDLVGYEQFYDFVKLPDKDRTEFSKKRNVIDVYNGNQGWTLDKGGIQDASAESVSDFQDGQKKDLDYLFRYRLNEEGMTFRYAGNDIVELKEVDWVEVVDRDRRTIRIALDRATHLPIRTIYITRDPTTHTRLEEVEYLSNYHPIQGVQTAFQVERERNGLKVFQVFLNECQYNTGLPDSLFTRASLEERWAHLSKGKKKK